MVDTTLLGEIRKIIREEVEAEGKRIHTDVAFLKTDVEVGIGKLEDRMKDIEISNSRLEKGQARIEQKLDREVTDIAETQREILIKLDKLDDHETRIADLEGKPVPRSH